MWNQLQNARDVCAHDLPPTAALPSHELAAHLCLFCLLLQVGHIAPEATIGDLTRVFSK